MKKLIRKSRLEHTSILQFFSIRDLIYAAAPVSATNCIGGRICRRDQFALQKDAVFSAAARAPHDPAGCAMFQYLLMLLLLRMIELVAQRNRLLLLLPLPFVF